MTQKLLHRRNGGAGVQEVAGERTPAVVRGERPYPGLDAPEAEPLVNGVFG
jgi:hypothetical protein